MSSRKLVTMTILLIAKLANKGSMKLRIKEILKDKNMTQAQLAELMGIHVVTLSKKLSGQKEHTVDLEWLDRFAVALDVPVSELLFPPKPARFVQVRSYVQAGNWAESQQWDEAEWYDVPIPDDSLFHDFKLYAAETRGPSMNKKYPEGSVLVFTDIVETQEDVEVGKRYIVERERADGLREVTVKLLWQDTDGHLWLVPESDDPRHQTPIPVTGDDGETVRILGRVRYFVSRE